ncbi:unnamed protein product [Brassicogethes aeneus]|uniref:Beta-1,4-mannosyltransferase n=1 Tax=Brassicogethes aeneus TaxID=1431903 RepID=A0A9P0ATA0_BRAAE|nr:unnamed protein product [Brassicogethes aeneus]
MALKTKNVCVVVLGDIGRSPRMQYHSLSLAKMGHKVDVLGYGETEPLEEVKCASSIYYHYLLPCPQIPIRLANYVFKTIWQILNLFFLLLFIRRPDTILVQNPPAIPSLFVCWIVARTKGAKLVIDWHNYAHTIMALNLSKTHILVKLTRYVESFIGQRADLNLCVTKAMKDDLLKNWNVSAITLYDSPPLIFQPISVEEKHNFYKKLGEIYCLFLMDNNETIFTHTVDGKIYLKENRPGLLVSSTSWTEDEDFSVLFSALQEYEEHHNSGNQRKLPDLICVITGKGHLKKYYCDKIAEQNWKHVTILTPWLESCDYPKILASADLGVSLHTSSSGLDLPMKVVDMFGCGLPVCAYDFTCLNELVKNGKNSYTFKDSQELSKRLQEWFDNFPNNEKKNSKEIEFKKELEQFQNNRWDENWEKVVLNEFI